MKNNFYWKKFKLFFKICVFILITLLFLKIWFFYLRPFFLENNIPLSEKKTNLIFYLFFFFLFLHYFGLIKF